MIGALSAASFSSTSFQVRFEFGFMVSPLS